MSSLDDLHARLVERASDTPDAAGRRALADALVREQLPLVRPAEQREIAGALCARVEGLGPLEALLADPSVSEVMVNGGGAVWVERFGVLALHPTSVGSSLLSTMIERILAPLGRRVDRSSPIVDARLADGSRVHVVVPPVSVDGACLTIRRFRAGGVSLTNFGNSEVENVLRRSVQTGANLLVSGGTGAGKTSLLNALAGVVDHERIITIEDTAELALDAAHVVRLETREPNRDGSGAVGARDLVRTALRMRPDRLIVGEIRGGEAIDMLQAMNTGHAGSMSTIHANSTTDALARLTTLALFDDHPLPIEAIRSQVSAAIDVVVQVTRMPDGGRSVVAVDEVRNFDESWMVRSLLGGAEPARAVRRVVP